MWKIRFDALPTLHFGQATGPYIPWTGKHFQMVGEVLLWWNSQRTFKFREWTDGCQCEVIITSSHVLALGRILLHYFIRPKKKVS